MCGERERQHVANVAECQQQKSRRMYGGSLHCSGNNYVTLQFFKIISFKTNQTESHFL